MSDYREPGYTAEYGSRLDPAGSREAPDPWERCSRCGETAHVNVMRHVTDDVFLCPDCRAEIAWGPKEKLSRTEKEQGLADAGYDTTDWEER